MIIFKTTDYSKISNSEYAEATSKDAVVEYKSLYDKRDKQDKIKEILKKAEAQIEDSSNPTVYTIFPAKKGDKVELYNKKNNRIQQYIGILYYKDSSGEYMLRIQSRFDKGEKNLFSNYITGKTLGAGAYLLGNNLFQEGHAMDLEPLLAAAFMRQIHQAFKKGVYRKYRTYERNDPKVRGTIDVARHIRLNPKFNGNIAYSYRELTADNDMNRLIFTTYKMMEKKYPWLKNSLQYDQNVKDYVAQMDQIMTPASKSEIQALLKKSNQKVSHPLYRKWESVRQTAIMIQRHMGNLEDEARESQIVGFLIDMNRAWEIYLEQIWANRSLDKGYEFCAQEEIKILENSRCMRPDFCWKSNSDSGDDRPPFALVLDAKNKPAWGEIATDKRSLAGSTDSDSDNRIRDDLYEVFSYMLALNCNVGGIVCPTSSEENDIQKRGPYNISEYTKGKTFCVLGLPVGSSEEDYEQYKKEMQDREKELANEVDNILEPNKT